jgi:hypothetical protein
MMWSILALKLSLGRCVDLAVLPAKRLNEFETFREKSAIETAF